MENILIAAKDFISQGYDGNSFGGNEVEYNGKAYVILRDAETMKVLAVYHCPKKKYAWTTPKRLKTIPKWVDEYFK